jgi:hypothetical protein
MDALGIARARRLLVASELVEAGITGALQHQPAPPAMAPASVRRNVPISPGRRCQRRERSRDRPQLQITAEVHSTTL